jgi:hypothetical protein
MKKRKKAKKIQKEGIVCLLKTSFGPPPFSWHQYRSSEFPHQLRLLGMTINDVVKSWEESQ